MRSEDLLKGTEIAIGSIPAVLSLVEAITKLVNAKEDPAAQLDALQTASEAVKLRMDQLKFPDEF